ncbi:MAG: TrmH family RNA methyltransferase, partial [Geodermatophilaceae bacterium]
MDLDLQQIGLSHPRIKQIVDLQRNTASNRAGMLVVEGLWAHNVVRETATQVEIFLWCPEATYSDEARLGASQMVALAETSYRISEKTLARISERDKPDGLVSIVRMPNWQRADIEFGPAALVLVADGLEIPGNLGTLLRTMDAVAADCLVLTNRRTRLSHPKVFRGSHGMSLSVPTVDFDEVTDAIDWLAENAFTVYLADTESAVDYRQADYSGRVAIVVGSERYGISKPWYERGFGGVGIPMLGRSDSLNVSISASVLLYQARSAQS